LPVVKGVTTPVALTVATVVLLLLHIPVSCALPSVLFTPVHMLLAPVIVPAFGVGVTVTLVVVIAVPQVLVAV
jgi:hypothetical protein